MDYILVFISTVLMALNFAVSKKYQTVEGAGMEAGLRFSAISGLIKAGVFFVLSGFQLEFSLFSLVMALAFAFFCVSYTLLGFQIMKRENMAVYMLFLMSGGMLLPYIFGVVFLNESISVFRVLGLLLILGAIAVTNRAKSRSSMGVYLLCAAVFILNGCVSIVSKCHQIDTAYTPVSSTAFVMYTGICEFLLCSLALLFCTKGRGMYSFSRKSVIWLMPLGAFINGVAYMLQLIGASTLPATVLYPIITGGGIVFVALFGRLFFKEKLTKSQIISIILCFVGTLMFL